MLKQSRVQSRCGAHQFPHMAEHHRPIPLRPLVSAYTLFPFDKPTEPFWPTSKSLVTESKPFINRPHFRVNQDKWKIIFARHARVGSGKKKWNLNSSTSHLVGRPPCPFAEWWLQQRGHSVTAWSYLKQTNQKNIRNHVSENIHREQEQSEVELANKTIFFNLRTCYRQRLT